MKTFKTMLSALLLFLFIASCTPEQESNWYKGNLHTHTYWSDGDAFPEMVLDWYKTNDYQFISLSDHNTLQTGEKWKKLPKSHIYEQAFDDYLAKYGADWVEYKKDTAGISVKLKTEAEYAPRFQDESFLILRAEEITDSFEGKPLHMNATNIQSLIKPGHGSSVAETLQNNIDAVNAQREKTGQPMIPHINHPNFGWAISVEDMKALRGERFFEVFNGHPMVRNYGDSARLGTEDMWDQINIAYLKRDQSLMYGLATDDSHHYHRFGGQFSNSGRGWIMVEAKSLSPEALIEAMEEGDFYASTGVTLRTLEQEDGEIELNIEAESGIQYTTHFVGVRKGGSSTEVFASVKGTTASFEMTDDILFVRARIESTRLQENPFREGDFEMAWTQPIVR
ncbi:MAG: histidinol-phosphatase [Roseivirga sp.]|nr:histidinol-phosphatase [Roseivirga sp.]